MVGKSLGLVAALLVASLALAAGQSYLEKFPYCACDRNLKDTSYRVDNTVTYSAEFGYCWTLRVASCERAGNVCCDADIKKVELDVFATCKGTKVSSFLNYKPTTTGATIYNPDGAAPDRWSLKLTNLGLTQATANGAVVCIKPTSGPCMNLETLCVPQGTPGVCGIALLSSTNKCCPVSYVGNQPPPPPPPSPPPPPPQCQICLTISDLPVDVMTPAVKCAAMAATANSELAAAGIMLATNFSCAGASAASVKVCGQALTSDQANAASTTLQNAFFYKQLAEIVYGYPCNFKYDVDFECLPDFTIREDCLGPAPFPFCECAKAALTPFALAKGVMTTTLPNGNTKNCFTLLNAPPPYSSGPCGKMAIAKKVEFYFSWANRKAILGAQDASGKALSNGWGPSGQDTFKVSQLDYTVGFVAANSPQLCVIVAKGTSIQDLCPGADRPCSAAIFDPSQNCCPIQSIY